MNFVIVLRYGAEVLYLLTAVLFLGIGFTLGMVARPAESNPYTDARSSDV